MAKSFVLAFLVKIDSEQYYAQFASKVTTIKCEKENKS